MIQGNLPMPYLDSVLDVYEFVFQKSPIYSNSTASKVKQEILNGLGNLLQFFISVKFIWALGSV